MLEQQLIDEFRQRLVGEADFDGKGIDPSAQPLEADAALAEVIIGDLEEAGALAEPEMCVHEDQSGRRRCRVIAFSLPEDSARLELITSAYVPFDWGEFLPNEAVADLAGKAARFFDYIAKRELERFEEDPEVAASVKRINESLSSIEEVRVHILTNALVRNRSVESLSIAGRTIEFSIWDLERLYRASGEEVTRERIEIDFKELLGAPLPALEMSPPPAEYETFLVIIPGLALSTLYDRFGPKLFEFNVRSFLQARGQVNKGIRETLKTEPERFLAYNNGLTATADEIDAGEHRGQTVIRRLRGLQIVNGAQTTASIHRAHKIDKIDVGRVAVAVKLTRVNPDKLGEFVPLIAKFANTQNPVQLADLSANNEFHIAMEHLSENEWTPGEESRWFYERARGAYEVARLRLGPTPAKRRDFDLEHPKSQKFTKTDLAKVWMTWWEQPHVVSKGAQKNFAAFMSELSERFTADWRPDREFYRDTVGLLLLFKGCQRAVRKASLQSYGANVATFMMARLKTGCGPTFSPAAIWETQELSAELSDLFVDWAPRIHSEIIAGAGSRNVTEFCKKEECWERIKAYELPRHSNIPEITGRATSRPSTVSTGEASDTEMIERCMALSGPEWAAVYAWAAASKSVADFDLKVVHTLVGWAMDDWKHHPSPKQAPYAIRVLDQAIAAGLPAVLELA